MKKIIHKWFLDFGKEEKWLNEMAAQGLCVTSVSFFRYEFEVCRPGEYSIRLELLKELPKHPESEHYISFVEETGAEHVASYYKWVYFRKKTADGAFDLFSDNESRIRHLKRILFMVCLLCIVNLIAGFYNIFIAITLKSDFNFIGVVNIVISVFLAVVYYKYYQKAKSLKKEQQIFEG